MQETIQFISLSEPSKNIRNSGLICYMKCTYNHLLGLFDEPVIRTDEYKTHVEWHVDVRHGDNLAGTVSIYDYKNGFDPREYPDEDVTWHLGGKNSHVAHELIAFVGPKPLV